MNFLEEKSRQRSGSNWWSSPPKWDVLVHYIARAGASIWINRSTSTRPQSAAIVPVIWKVFFRWNNVFNVWWISSWRVSFSNVYWIIFVNRLIINCSSNCTYSTSLFLHLRNSDDLLRFGHCLFVLTSSNWLSSRDHPSLSFRLSNVEIICPCRYVGEQRCSHLHPAIGQLTSSRTCSTHSVRLVKGWQRQELPLCVHLRHAVCPSKMDR